MGTPTSAIRNIAISGHGGTGKTTLVEQILADGGVIPKPERVETGKTVSDFADEEIARKISIHASLSHVNWKNTKINLLDTPGAGDFVGEVIAAFTAADAAMVVLGADVGVQIETIKLWRRLEAFGMPRFIVVNKMDKERADFDKCLADLKEKFKASFVPVIVPIGSGAELSGVVDLVEMKARIGGKDVPIPAAFQPKADTYRQALTESAAEGDDALIEKYFAEGRLSNEEVRQSLRRGLREGKLVPVLAVSGLSNVGVDALLDFIAAEAQAPSGDIKAFDAEGKETVRKIDPAGAPACFVFKTAIDQFTGKITYFKVLSGRIAADADLICVREGKKERITKLYTCQGKKLEETSDLEAGDIGLLTKSPDLRTNDTICVPDHVIRYPDLQLPQPVHSLAISAMDKKNEDKMNQMLQRAAEEDLTFRINYDKETRETVISGMGELHISMILDKIREGQKIEMETKVPKVAYRETITGSGGAEYTHKKQTGGHGQYAKVEMEVHPLPRGEKYKFTNAIFGGSIPKNFIPAVEKGVIEGLESGVLAGYPVVDVEAKVTDGKHHPVDSSELAFKLAARESFRESMRKAKPVLLEPVMNLTVFVDDQYLGDVLSDLSGKRGKVSGQNPIGGGIQEIKAQVPHSELLTYALDLKALTSATGSFEVEFDHYSPISGRLSEDVIKAAQAAKEEEKKE